MRHDSGCGQPYTRVTPWQMNALRCIQTIHAQCGYKRVHGHISTVWPWNVSTSRARARATYIIVRSDLVDAVVMTSHSCVTVVRSSYYAHWHPQTESTTLADAINHPAGLAAAKRSTTIHSKQRCTLAFFCNKLPSVTNPTHVYMNRDCASNISNLKQVCGHG